MIRKTGGNKTCPPILALFQKRIEGDDALLELAKLRFKQAGLGAEFYAETPEELESLLRFRPSVSAPVFVHLPRRIDLFRREDRGFISDLAERFRGRINGMTVHDQKEMQARPDDYEALLRDLEQELGKSGCPLFVEYAAGLPFETFEGFFEKIGGLAHIGCCIDIGHIGLRHVRNVFEKLHPERDLFGIRPTETDLPFLIDDIQSAVDSALDRVLPLIRKIGAAGKPVHFHLHDGHPLSNAGPFGVSDHLSFFERIVIPFAYKGKNFLPLMFGPSGLSRILATAVETGRDKVSFTIEVHPSGGKLPLGDAAHLFDHWKDKGNAERMNHWLSVLLANAGLVRQACAGREGQAVRSAAPLDNPHAGVDNSEMAGQFPKQNVKDDDKTKEQLIAEIAELRKRCAEMAESLSELKNQERKLIEYEKLSALGRLTANVAHEIRNPVTVIGGLAKRLSRGVAAGTSESEDLELISVEVGRLEELLRDVLFFSNKPFFHREEHDINEIVDESLEAYREPILKRSINVRRLFGSVPKIYVDKNHVSAAVRNLVSNAVDAMPEGGLLTAHTDRDSVKGKSYIYAAITDTGAGISEDKIKMIFEPFFTTKVAKKQAWLGLPIAKRMVEGHGGFIRIASEPGKGSSFSLYFPLRGE